MNIPDFDMKVLLDIAECEDGWSRQDLANKHGPEISETIDLLISEDLVRVHEHDIKPFLPDGNDYKDPPKGNIVATRLGRIEVKRWREKHASSAKERRVGVIIGLISGIFVSVLGNLILAWLSK